MCLCRSGVPVAGIGFTGALASIPPKRGDHRLVSALLDLDLVAETAFYGFHFVVCSWNYDHVKRPSRIVDSFRCPTDFSLLGPCQFVALKSKTISYAV